ncbi:MAG: protein-L-isoaspartate(D-aspartate) O-methyltransferase [Actinobacteria bacterium]|nr:protein-L-isoaspartate(D-aspartate) O-methyltransferase [Actinomycetota bacterium]
MAPTELDERDFANLRRHMVESQLRRRGIGDARVLQAMEKVPRHRFVGETVRWAAYDDEPLPIGLGQTISQPYVVARMTELLELNRETRVLEVGTGSGYQAAILAEIAAEVWTIERHQVLAERARELLAALGYTNVHVVRGDGTLGLPEHAPYDAIIVTAAAPQVPAPLREQLAEGGRLVIPVGDEFSQLLRVVVRRGDVFPERDVLGVRFVPLVGEQGYPPRGET